jgi:hypothetical protein
MMMPGNPLLNGVTDREEVALSRRRPAIPGPVSYQQHNKSQYGVSARMRP